MSINRKSLLAVESTWLYRANSVQIGGLCVLIALLLATFNVGLRWLLLQGLQKPQWVMVADILTASLPALLAYKIFVDTRTRRHGIIDRLRMIAELNHQVRNALDVIQLSAHLTKDRQAIALIDSSVAKIDHALRDVLDGR